MTNVELLEQSNTFIRNKNNNINNDDDIIRTINDRIDTLSTTDRREDTFNKNNASCNGNINIYRYKFTQEFTDEMFKFSKVHQYDHRKDFKDAWNIWLEENDEIVNDEIRRLTNLGYDGNIQDKMFKSAKYYFRKKGTEKKEPIKRKDYIGVQRSMLDAMDKHIISKIVSDVCKPSDCFNEFCKNNIDLLKEEINSLYRNGISDSAEIKQKLKKTYKNRYFLITNK